jgi:hypothetical protein
MSESPVPTTLAMLLCDTVIVDELTKKKSLIGVFEDVNTVALPANMNCALYAKIVDAEGNYNFRIRLVSLKNETVITELPGASATIPDRLKAVELAINLVGLQLPEAGKYEFQLFGNDVYLARITMEVRQLQLGGMQWPRP